MKYPSPMRSVGEGARRAGEGPIVSEGRLMFPEGAMVPRSLTPAERVFGWNSFEVLAFKTGNPDNPVNAIPGRAVATCQIRFVAGCDVNAFIGILRRHLDAEGFGCVQIGMARKSFMQATRLDPDNPWVCWAAESIRRTTGTPPAGG